MHGLLFETFDWLKEINIWLNYNPDIASILQTLKNEAVINYELQKSRYGGAIIIKNVASPKLKTAPDKTPKMSWWQLW